MPSGPRATSASTAASRCRAPRSPSASSAASCSATGHRARATRRGYSTVYDERSGNFVRRGNVDWQSDYAGNRAGDDMPVVHVSAKDAMAYAEWLSQQTGQRYRLPSEAEFEYALRAGSDGRFPWGDGIAAGAQRATSPAALDVSPSGRRWRNAFAGYGDGSWGPAPVGSFRANAFGLHDLAGNVSEWVADCWHDSYRRAPRDGAAWVNPGCRYARGARRLLGQFAGTDALGLAPGQRRQHHQRADRVPRGARDLTHRTPRRRRADPGRTQECDEDRPHGRCAGSRAGRGAASAASAGGS